MNPWEELKEHTQARIGLHRAGHSISTHDWLDFELAHALAKDAVHETWDFKQLESVLRSFGEDPLLVNSAVNVRELYLKFPNLGRKLAKDSHAELAAYQKKHAVDVAFIITDGLSASAVHAHAFSFWKVLRPLLFEKFPDLSIAIVLAPFGRVALSDDIGKVLKAKMSIMLVGERPGLSSHDSLGIYLTYAPKASNTDAERNCISNIHPPEGLSYDLAADKLLFLMGECFRLKLSGVSIKEQVGCVIEHPHIKKFRTLVRKKSTS